MAMEAFGRHAIFGGVSADPSGAMARMMRVLVRVEAGPGVGLGHLQRCLALASALRGQRIECAILAADEPAVQGRIRGSGFTAFPLKDVEPGSEGDWTAALEIAAQERCGGVVVDSYRIDERYVSELRAAGLVVTAIDDMAHFPIECHLVVNSGVEAESLQYRPLASDTRFLLGPRYAMLGDGFWNVEPRRVGAEVKEVLVTMGGADGHNLTPAVLEALESLRGDFSVAAVIGPFFQNEAEVEAMASRCHRRVRLVRIPDSVRSLMLKADLAISAAGQTLYELAATGTPAVAAQVAENQADNLRGFSQHGVITPISFGGREQFQRALAQVLSSLLTCPQRRLQMSQAGQRLVDGLGAKRVAAVMAEMLEGHA